MKRSAPHLFGVLWLLAIPGITSTAAEKPTTTYGRGWDVSLASTATVCSGDTVFMTWPGGAGDKDRCLISANVATPAAPKLLATTTVPGFPQGMTVADNTLYLVTGRELLLFDVSNPATLRQRGTLEISEDPMRGPQGVAVHDGVAYLACRRGGVRVVDVSDVDSPTVIGECPVEAFVTHVAVHDGKLLVSADARGLVVLDISSPQKPRVVQRVSFPRGCAGGISVAGDSVVAGGGSEVAVCLGRRDDGAYQWLGSTSNRQILSPYYGRYSFETAFLQVDAADAGRYVVAADGESGLIVVDASDPDSPEFHAALMDEVTIGTPYYITSLCVKNRIAFLSDNRHGLRVVDLSDPSRPKLLGDGIHLTTAGE